MKITAIISAMWSNQPKVGRTKKPSSHKTKRITPISNKIFITTSFICIVSVYCDVPIILVPHTLKFRAFVLPTHPQQVCCILDYWRKCMRPAIDRPGINSPRLRVPRAMSYFHILDRGLLSPVSP